MGTVIVHIVIGCLHFRVAGAVTPKPEIPGWYALQMHYYNPNLNAGVCLDCTFSVVFGAHVTFRAEVWHGIRFVPGGSGFKV